MDANPYEHNLVIGIGSRDGVYDGQAIVDANGVLGQVIETELMTAQAILISDADHALPVEVNRNGLRSIAVGTGSINRLELLQDYFCSLGGARDPDEIRLALRGEIERETFFKN